MELYIITFKHGNYAVAVFNKLQGYGVRNIHLSQTPFSIKSACDICIKAFGRDAYNIVMKECKKVPVDNVYMEIKQDGKTLYKLL